MCCPAKGWTFDPPANAIEQQFFTLGVTSIIHHAGTFVGCYIDNEVDPAPHLLTGRTAVVNKVRAHAAALSLAATLTIVVGLYPSEIGVRIPGAVCALEWYPFPLYPHDPLPAGQQAYITQWWFRYSPDNPDLFDPAAPLPSLAKRTRLYDKALRYKPKLVLRY